jgi:hypothetical protein
MQPSGLGGTAGRPGPVRSAADSRSSTGSSQVCLVRAAGGPALGSKRGFGLGRLWRPAGDADGNLLPGGLLVTCGDATITVRILEGDLNLDCQVNIIDEQLIALRYGAVFRNPFYEAWYDLEPALKDMNIDIKDIQKVFGRNGSTCQDPVPPQPPLPAPP